MADLTAAHVVLDLGGVLLSSQPFSSGQTTKPQRLRWTANFGRCATYRVQTGPCESVSRTS